MRPLLLRVDGDDQIGTGHLMRCLALAQAWRRRAGAVLFLSALLPRGFEHRLVGEGFEVVRLLSEPGGIEDAREVVEIARSRDVAAIVCDNYHFGLQFQKMVAMAGIRFLVIADEATAEPFDCDVLLNQNLGFGRGDYPALTMDTETLMGSTYCLLRQEFYERRMTAPNKPIDRSRRRRILITFGGADPHNTLGRVLPAIGPVATVEGWEVRAVVGGANPNSADIEAEAARHPSIEVVFDVTDMATLMEWCDIAISAAGSTVWELCFLGIPCILTSIADNQTAIRKAVAEAGAAIDLGAEPDIDLERLVSAAKSLLNDGACWTKMASQARELVDGAGADRVAAALDVSLRLTIATADTGWVRNILEGFVQRLELCGHHVSIVHDASDIPMGDIAFFLSFWSLVPPEILSRNAHNLVVHASDLPRGKGWSPMTWQILEGKGEIPVTLFEAEKGVDSGDVYFKEIISLRGHELLPELRRALMAKSYELCERFVDEYPAIASRGTRQSGDSTFYQRRVPEDSRLDPEQTLLSQFDLLRTVDNDAYPAYFEHLGCRYKLTIERADDDAK